MKLFFLFFVFIFVRLFYPSYMFIRFSFLGFSSLLLYISLGTTIVGASSFSDVGGREERKAIEYFQENGVINGYKDGTYKPEKEISRSEFLSILLKTSTLPIETCSLKERNEISLVFSDVPQDEWYTDIICNARKSGIIQGYEDGSFRPNDPISFAEAAKIIALTQKIDIDLKNTQIWYQKFIDGLIQEKSIPIEIASSPAKKFTRGEMADITWSVVTGNEISTRNSEKLPRIDSCNDLSLQMKKFERRQIANYRGIKNEDIISPLLETNPEMSQLAKENTAPSGDYSQTNVQEEGVDEADIVKNDGSHIFVARQNEIRIVQAFPIENIQEDTKITYKDFVPQDMYLDGNRLVVLGRKASGPSPIYMEDAVFSRSFYPYPQETTVYVYNISDRKNPQQIRSLSVSGSLLSSRKIGDTVYIIANSYISSSDEFSEENLPKFSDTGTNEQNVLVSKCSDITYFPNFQTENLAIIMAIDIQSPKTPITRTSFLGSGNTIYASQKNLYITEPSYDQVYTDENGNASWEWRSLTKIYKYALDGMDISFAAKGNVLGSPLSSFSMSEFNDYFRVATHQWEGKQENIVTILDSTLQKKSEIRNIANGESLKSARFMGDKAYLVTFKQVDPFFVLDISPDAPKILGELKIPGWSDYLHPIDDTHLIGFGREVDPSAESRENITPSDLLGMKLSLFDVSDLKNPKETFKTVIGERGTTSAILNDYKALLYDGERKIIGFPLTISKASGEWDTKATFSGAQVYSFSLENGFSLVGQTTHFPRDAKNLWDPNAQIQRIVRIGDVFYSVSRGMVKALSTQDLSEIKSLPLVSTAMCSDIYSETDCLQKTECKALYEHAYCPPGKICIQSLQFSRCESREE
jgi:inhibitor of cysteine peptidase